MEAGLRPCIVVSCDKSNHDRAPQVTVVPLSCQLKDNPVHVQVSPEDVRGYRLKRISDFMPEDIQTLAKGCIRGKTGYIPENSTIRDEVDRAIILQLNLLNVARKMIEEEEKNAEKNR